MSERLLLVNLPHSRHKHRTLHNRTGSVTVQNDLDTVFCVYSISKRLVSQLQKICLLKNKTKNKEYSHRWHTLYKKTHKPWAVMKNISRCLLTLSRRDFCSSLQLDNVWYIGFLHKTDIFSKIHPQYSVIADQYGGRRHTLMREKLH